ncbi:hypothetical protein B0T10DRAFT_323541 [Thelonectria olida]|uniref:Uncharacterized protein n=1 Tax=Thelonectria olida TaxID=1576542 RepID=A0A9P8W5Y8_9HYPO|nr:hypothetical protein B0T10DRAFT_323541 [Thelonectria olida]
MPGPGWLLVIPACLSPECVRTTGSKDRCLRRHNGRGVEKGSSSSLRLSLSRPIRTFPLIARDLKRPHRVHVAWRSFAPTGLVSARPASCTSSSWATVVSPPFPVQSTHQKMGPRGRGQFRPRRRLQRSFVQGLRLSPSIEAHGRLCEMEYHGVCSPSHMGSPTPTPNTHTHAHDAGRWALLALLALLTLLSTSHPPPCACHPLSLSCFHACHLPIRLHSFLFGGALSLSLLFSSPFPSLPLVHSPHRPHLLRQVPKASSSVLFDSRQRPRASKPILANRSCLRLLLLMSSRL